MHAGIFAHWFMKRLFVILLSCLYLALSSGFTRYSHVCKGMATRQMSLTNDKHPDKPCPICAAKEKGLKKQKKDCCKHDSQTIKIADAAKKQSYRDFSVTFWGEAIPNRMLGAVFDFSIENETVACTAFPSSKIPIRSNPLYILHCVYRI